MDLLEDILLEKLRFLELSNLQQRALLCSLLAVFISCTWLASACAEKVNVARDTGANDQWCKSSTATQGYVSIQDLERLRKMSQDSSSKPVAFSRLNSVNGEVVAEALRIGPRGAFFAARVLRDLMIIEALNGQARCGDAQCPKPAIISEFQIKRPTERDAPTSWEELRDLWIKFRDDDAGSGAHCLEISRGLPTASTETLSASAPEKSISGEPVDVQPGNVMVAAGAGQIPPQLVGLDAADLRYCQVRSANSADQSQVSDEEVRQLREDFNDGQAPFLAGLRDKHREPVEESLRVGPKAGYFAHHVLRILVIIKEIDRQLNCSSCTARNDIQELKRNDTWEDLLQIWRSIRDTDLNRALVCMKYSKTLPTLKLAPMVVASSEKPKADKRTLCDIDSSLQRATIRFAKSRSKADASQLLQLASIVSILQGCPNLSATIAGHTDQDGSAAYNVGLSRTRASSVAAYMVQNGVNSGQIEVRGFGETQRLSKGSSSFAKAQDRRAEVQLRRSSRSGLGHITDNTKSE